MESKFRKESKKNKEGERNNLDASSDGGSDPGLGEMRRLATLYVPNEAIYPRATRRAQILDMGVSDDQLRVLEHSYRYDNESIKRTSNHPNLGEEADEIREELGSALAKAVDNYLEQLSPYAGSTYLSGSDVSSSEEESVGDVSDSEGESAHASSSEGDSAGDVSDSERESAHASDSGFLPQHGDISSVGSGRASPSNPTEMGQGAGSQGLGMKRKGREGRDISPSGAGHSDKRSRIASSTGGVAEWLARTSVTEDVILLHSTWTSYQDTLLGDRENIGQELQKVSAISLDEIPRSKYNYLQALSQFYTTVSKWEKAFLQFKQVEETYALDFQSTDRTLREGIASTTSAIATAEQTKTRLETMSRLRRQGAQGTLSRGQDQTSDEMEVDEPSQTSDEMEVDKPTQAHLPEPDRSTSKEPHLSETTQEIRDLTTQLDELHAKESELEAKLASLTQDSSGYQQFRAQVEVQHEKNDEVFADHQKRVKEIFEAHPDLAREYAFKTNDSPLIPLARQSMLDTIDDSDLSTTLRSHFETRDRYESMGLLIYDFHEDMEDMPLLTTRPLYDAAQKALGPFGELSKTMREANFDPNKVPYLPQRLDTFAFQVSCQFAEVMPTVCEFCSLHARSLHERCLTFNAPKEFADNVLRTLPTLEQWRFDLRGCVQELQGWDAKPIKDVNEILRKPPLDHEHFKRCLKKVHTLSQQVDSWEKKNDLRALALIEDPQREQRRDWERDPPPEIGGKRVVSASGHGMSCFVDAILLATGRDRKEAEQIRGHLESKKIEIREKMLDGRSQTGVIRHLRDKGHIEKNQAIEMFIYTDDQGSADPRLTSFIYQQAEGREAGRIQLFYSGRDVHFYALLPREKEKAKIEVTKKLRDRYKADQADKSGAQGRKLTYTNPRTKKEEKAFFIPRDEKGDYGDTEKILAVLNETGEIATLDQLHKMLRKRAAAKNWEIKKYGEIKIEVTEKLRDRYKADQADKSGAQGRKLTYTNPRTKKEEKAFFIPRDEKGDYGDTEKILAVLNETGEIATLNQLYQMLGKRAAAKNWEVKKYGEIKIEVTEKLRDRYKADQADKTSAQGRKLTYTDFRTKKEKKAFFIPRDEKGDYGYKEEILAVLNETGEIATLKQLQQMLGKRAAAKNWRVKKYREIEIEVTEELRDRYKADQADKTSAQGRKLTYTDPITREEKAFFIPRDEKGDYGDEEEILAVLNETGEIATLDQLHKMLGKKACAGNWNVEKYGEIKIEVTEELRDRYKADQADKTSTQGRKLTYTDPITKEEKAFFIPRNEKGAYGDTEKILAVLNETREIATLDQLYQMLGKRAAAKNWEVKKYGEA